MRDQIAAWVRDASSDLFVRVVVITAAGDKAFCTGADLRGGRLPPRPKPDDAPEGVMGDGARMIRDGWQAPGGLHHRLREAGHRRRERHRRRRRACTWLWPAIWS